MIAKITNKELRYTQASQVCGGRAVLIIQVQVNSFS